MQRAGAETRERNMPDFLVALETKYRTEATRARVDEQDLKQWGLTGKETDVWEKLVARQQCKMKRQVLGSLNPPKHPPQTIALLIYLAGRLNDEGPFLILCPLSVLGNWKEEMERFAPGFSCAIYTGEKEERARLQQDLKQESHFNVLLTTYEVCLKDAAFLKS